MSFTGSTLLSENSQASESFPVGGKQGRLFKNVGVSSVEDGFS